MESSPTLQDFVLNLIYDPGARSAFELDPQGTLHEAGLADVTAADVREVIPLVMDYAPLGAGSSLPGPAGADELSTGVANLDVAGAVAHLQAITAQVAGTPSQITGDLNVAAAVTVSAGAQVTGLLGNDLALNGYLFGGAGVGGGAATLSADHDPAAGLDAGATEPLVHGVTDVVTGAGGVLPHSAGGVLTHGAGGVLPDTTGILDGTANTVTGLSGSIGIDHPLGLDVPGLHEATSSVIGSLGGSHVTGGLLPDLSHPDSTTGHTEHHLSSVTDLTGGLTHPTEPEASHDVLGGLTDLHF